MKKENTIFIPDAIAFEKAMLRIRERLVLTAVSFLHDADEAEDIVQEALMRCWVARQRFDNSDELLYFAVRIVKNLCIDILRKRKYAVYGICEDEVPSVETNFIEREQQNRMLECMKRLPVGARAILQMKGIDALSYNEIATMLGTTEAAVRAKVAKARQILCSIYNKIK